MPMRGTGYHDLTRSSHSGASAGFQIPSYYQAGNARKAYDSQGHWQARGGPARGGQAPDLARCGVTGRTSQQSLSVSGGLRSRVQLTRSDKSIATLGNSARAVTQARRDAGGVT